MISGNHEGWSDSSPLPGPNYSYEYGEGFGIYDSFDNLIARISRVVDSGVKRVKLKMAHGWNFDMLEAVRSTFPTQTFHVDCNSSYAPEEIDQLVKLDKFGLAMIEQPFALNDFVSHAKLQKRMETPICPDEAIVDVTSVRQALELGCCRYVNIKSAHVGGLGNSLEINRLCREAGVGCWVGGMLESDVGKGICAELDSIGNMTYPHDISPESGTYPDPLCSVHLDLPTRWTVRCADHPGTPIKPDMEKLAQKTIRKIVLEGERNP